MLYKASIILYYINIYNTPRLSEMILDKKFDGTLD